ncbi:MAG: hypothetical protein IJS61_04310 [Firmicutes bacterium]|nr:hypothetical protein [Bacillota bacterium]
MAKDNYFVIVYKILAYMYKCLKDGKYPDTYNILNAESYCINEGYFKYILEELYVNGYIRGLKASYAMNGELYVFFENNFKISEKGILFIEENTIMEKAYKAIKKAMDIIPGV